MDHAAPFLITTPRKGRGATRRAMERAARIGVPFVPRDDAPIEDLFDLHGARGIWVESADAPVIHTRKGELAYHEGTAALRVKKNASAPGALARALDLRPGDRVLDATLGMGFDALVIAAGLGPAGSVTGLEASPLLCELVRCGLENYQYRPARLAQAASRITAVCERHEIFLEQCGPDSFDAVYFDPMFESTIEASSSMQRLREIAVHDPLTDRSLFLARSAARRRVAVKCRRERPGRHGFDEFFPSGQSVGYGVFLCGNAADGE